MNERAPRTEPVDELPSTVQQVVQRELNFGSDEEYRSAAVESSESREVSEDAFVRTMRGMAEWLQQGAARSRFRRNDYGVLLRILDRESMQDHPNRELFRQAIQDLADRDGHKLKV